MDLLYFAVSVSLAALIPILYWKWITMSTHKNLPPGPKGIPLLGSFHYLGGISHLAMERLAKKYGNVFSLRFFHIHIVCVNGYVAMKELMVEKAKEMCDRPEIVCRPPIKQQPATGIVQGRYGPNWMLNRTLFLRAFREITKHQSIENVIQRETLHLMENFEETIRKNGLVDPKKILFYTALNVITSFVFGEVFELDNKRVKHIFHLNYDFFNSPVPNIALVFLYQNPILKKIWIPNFLRIFQDRKKQMTQFCEDEIEKHKKSLDSNCPRDFIDYYLIHTEHTDKAIANESELCSTLFDLFQAGMGGVATTINWAILYMAKHQDIQVQLVNPIIVFPEPVRKTENLEIWQ